jgi:hypothetical protein
MTVINQNKVQINLEDQGSTRNITISGIIDEEFNFKELLGDFSQMSVDFKELKVINSCGIREWISYHNCPQIIIQQMNMVAGFLSKNAKVISFYAPYYCEESDEEKMVLLESKNIENNKAPVITQEVNGESVELEFDAIEEQYFKFLKD